MVLGSEARSGFVGANRYHTVVENTLSIYLSLPLAAVGTRVLSMHCVPCPLVRYFYAVGVDVEIATLGPTCIV